MTIIVGEMVGYATLHPPYMAALAFSLGIYPLARMPGHLTELPHFAAPRRGINPPAESQRMLRQPVSVFHVPVSKLLPGNEKPQGGDRIQPGVPAPGPGDTSYPP